MVVEIRAPFQEYARCVKSPGVQHTPTDDPDVIQETVSSRFPSAALQSAKWMMRLALILLSRLVEGDVAAKRAL